jgi:hypothetical protein
MYGSLWREDLSALSCTAPVVGTRRSLNKLVDVLLEQFNYYIQLLYVSRSCTSNMQPPRNSDSRKKASKSQVSKINFHPCCYQLTKRKTHAHPPPRAGLCVSSTQNVACRAVTMRNPSDRQINIPNQFLGNSWMNTFQQQWIDAQQQWYCCKWGFLLGPCGGDIRKTIGATKFSYVWESVKRGLEHVKLYSSDCWREKCKQPRYGCTWNRIRDRCTRNRPKRSRICREDFTNKFQPRRKYCARI